MCIISLFIFFYSTYTLLPYSQTFKEFLGDSLIACNVLRPLYYNPILLNNTSNNTSLYVQNERNPALDFHVALELSWYIAILPYTKEKSMYIHHTLTILLLSIGYYYNITYVTFLLLGTIIWSNVCLHVAKITHKNNHKLKDKVFLLFTILFFITRIIIFPFYIAPIITFRLHDNWVTQQNKFVLYYGVNVGMYVLILMQFYWFCKIVRILFQNYKEHKH